MDSVRPGKYRHFKGGLYQVLCTAIHSESLEKMVVYQALDGSEKIWVRPEKMWNETVALENGVCERFAWIGE